MGDLKVEKFEKVEKGFVYNPVRNLTEVSEDLFEKESFSKGDVVLVDIHETLVPTWDNLLERKPLDYMPQDSRDFLKGCKDRGIETAIVTNASRNSSHVRQYVDNDMEIFGYKGYFKNKFLSKIEFPLTLMLGSLYKQTVLGQYEVGAWSLNKLAEDGRIAFIGNSYFDKHFAEKFEKVLRVMDFDENFYFYSLPCFRSFRK